MTDQTTTPASAVAEQELADVAAEIAKAAALVRKSLVEDAEYLDDDYRAASEALAVVLEKTSANFGRIPAGVAIATLNLARALSVLDEDSDDDAEDVKPAPRTPPLSPAMFDTIRRAERLAKDHGDHALSNSLYGLGCTLGSMR